MVLYIKFRIIHCAYLGVLGSNLNLEIDLALQTV